MQYIWLWVGGATYYSYEYERLFRNDKTFFLAAGAGLGTATEGEQTDYVTMPFHVSGNVGKRVSIFEFGVGTTLIFNNPDRNSISYLLLGYRLSLPKRHKTAFCFKLNLSISFKYFNVIAEGNPQFIPLGLGVGIAF